MIDAIFFIVALIGLAAGFALVARSPTFWVGLALVVWTKAKPFLLKRMPKEDEDEIRKAAMRGEKTADLWFKLKRKRQKRNSST